MSLLQTVCAAGGARAGFNGDANARLEQLVEEGLLDASPLNAHPQLLSADEKRRHDGADFRSGRNRTFPNRRLEPQA